MKKQKYLLIPISRVTITHHRFITAAGVSETFAVSADGVKRVFESKKELEAFLKGLGVIDGSE